MGLGCKKIGGTSKSTFGILPLEIDYDDHDDDVVDDDDDDDDDDDWSGS